MVDVANTDLGGKYIFAGKLNRMPPFARNGDEITYGGDFKDIFREISFGTGYKVAGPGVGDDEPTGPFGGAEASGPPYELLKGEEQYHGAFGAMFQLRDALNSGNTDEVSKSLERVQQEVDHLLQERVKVGARTRHFESVKDQILGQEIRLKQIELDIGGVHIEKASIDLAQQSLTYQAALGSSAQILQTSLLHFLK
jgi:flagellar hook-associated protein 3 FlgL